MYQKAEAKECPESELITMTARERIMAALQRADGPLCDDCLVPAAQLRRRQDANRHCRQLADEGLVLRERDWCPVHKRKKLMNALLRGNAFSSQPRSPRPAPRLARDGQPPDRSWYWEQLSNGEESALLSVLRRALERFCTECLAEGYEVLLEADVASWLFHFLLEDARVDAKQLHCDTRVCEASGKYDMALGTIAEAEDGRPCVAARLVVEIKVFPRLGFTDQAHRVHYEHVLGDDLPKLGSLAAGVPCRAALLLDGRGYLEGTYKGMNRRQHVIETRNRVAAGVHVFVVRLSQGKWLVEHVERQRS